MTGAYICPICGGTIAAEFIDGDKIIVIRTKRRSTVLVHNDCIISQQRKGDQNEYKERKEKQRN